jgi:hypothetical protein
VDAIQCSTRSECQESDRYDQPRAVNGGQPNEPDGRFKHIRERRPLEAHVDHQTHTQLVQLLAVLPQGGIANEKFVRDAGEIHGRHLTTGKETNA